MDMRLGPLTVPDDRWAVSVRRSVVLRVRSRTVVVVLSETARQAVSIGLAVVLVRFMSPADFGTYRQVELAAIFVFGVLGLNLPASLYYFVPKLGPAHYRALLWQNLGLALAAALAAGAALYGLAPWLGRWWSNEALVTPLRICGLLGLAYLLTGLIPPFFISLDRPVRAGIYTLLFAILRAAPVIVLAAWGASLALIFAATAAVLTFGTLGVMGDAFRFCPGPAQRPTRALLFEQLTYVLPLQAAMLVGLANRQLDKWLISTGFDPASLAVYACGAFELPMVGMITNSVANAIMPNLVTLSAQGRVGAALTLWQTAARKCSLLMYPCFALALVCAHDLIRLLFGTDYERAAWPFIVYLFALPIRVAVYGALLRALGRTRPVVVAAALGLGANVVLGGLFLVLGRGGWLSFIGPSIAVVAAEWVGAAYMLRHIMRLGDTSLARVMRWRELGGVLLLSVAAAAAAALVPLGDWPVTLRLLLRAVVYVFALAVALVAARALHDDERDLLVAPWRVLGRWGSWRS